MTILRRIGSLVSEIARSSPRKALVSVMLMVAVTLTEGLGLLLLMPLLTLVGVNEPNTLPNVTGWFNRAFRLVGLAPSLGSVLILFVAIAGVRTLIQRWQDGLSADVREQFTADLRIRLYRAIAGADWGFLVGRRQAEFGHALSEEIGELGRAAFYVVDLVALLMVSLAYLGLAFHLSPRVALLVLACAGVLAWGVRGTLENARIAGDSAALAWKRLDGAATEHIIGMKTARTYGAVDRHIEEFSRLAEGLRTSNLDVRAGEAELQQTLEFGSTAMLALIVYVALEIIGEPAAPMLVLLFAFARLMPRIVAIYRHVQTLAAALPVLESVKTLERDCVAAREPAAGRDEDLTFTHEVRFDGVAFRYPSQAETWAIRDVNLCIPAGCTTAIVGPSGAGKSTLADLLIGLLSPTDGRILVDGEALGPERLAAWRRHISYVPQETFLFHDTVRANLEWARPGVTDDELWRALHLAAADEFVRMLPAKLDTIVGDRGILLSGGERQRLSLARAIVRAPRMLVLDEATSALDSENELWIQQAIEGLHQLMTIVIITHRLSTIRHADAIYVIDGGRIVQSGTWDVLLADGRSRFGQLCAAQGISWDAQPFTVPAGQW